MGLDINGTKFVLYAKSLGVDFSKTAMIGRQELYLSPSELESKLKAFGYQIDKEEISSIFHENDGYAEAFLRSLGADEVHSFDFSSYEGATHTYDMNDPLPAEYAQVYSTVLDGGSLEHVFNFPVAIKNCMEMLQVGGHYLGITPSNNFMGHGFYQFSPEIFFSIFTNDNGFEIVDVIVFEDRRNAEWFSVKNPKTIQRRVTLTNHTPTYLLVIAKRVAVQQIFRNTPQQSDYMSVWNSPGIHDEPTASIQPRTRLTSQIKRFLRPHLNQFAKRQIRRLYRFKPEPTLYNRKFFEAIEFSNKKQSPDKTLRRTH